MHGLFLPLSNSELKSISPTYILDYVSNKLKYILFKFSAQGKKGKMFE